MRSRLAVFILLLVCLVFALLFARQMHLSKNLPRAAFTDKKLRILTYSTFVGATGPGGEIIDRFKKERGCEVEVLTAGDAGLMLERLKIAQVSTPFDVVIGLDQLQLDNARAVGGWKSFQFSHEGWNDEALSEGSDMFVPFDWSPMTFIYRQGTIDPPQAFPDMLAPRFKAQFALQDPRASTPGLQFYNWVRSVEGDQTVDFLTRFKENVQSISPSWAFSYGLFKKNQASFVFSYVTSLAYHWGSEKDRNYQAVSFPEGHPVQIEYAAVPASCRECDLAQDLVRSMLMPTAQKLLMAKNFMFPVLKEVETDSIFSELPQLKIRPSSNLKSKDFSDWDKVFKH